MNKGIIMIGARIFQDHGVSTWPFCSPPRKEYAGEPYQQVAKNPTMVFDIYKEGDSWICWADGYGALRSKGQVGDYGNGAIAVFKEEDITFFSEDKVEPSIEEDAARYRWLKSQKSFELIKGPCITWVRVDGSSVSSPYSLAVGDTWYAACETIDMMIDTARKGEPCLSKT
jgi:hypothetical protein